MIFNLHGDVSTILMNILYFLPGIILGFTIHEFFHAYTAYKCGDLSQRHGGRLTLSPFAHIDPIGFIMILIFGFGWAKPVPVHPHSFKKPRRDDILVSLAGPLSNFVLAFVFLLAFYLLFAFSPFTLFTRGFQNNGMHIAMNILLSGAEINIFLFTFNLLPIPPLDGYHIMSNLLPAHVARSIRVIEQYSMIILLGFIFILSRHTLLPIAYFIFSSMSSFISFIISPLL